MLTKNQEVNFYEYQTYWRKSSVKTNKKEEKKTKSGILLSSKSSNTDTQNQAEVIALGKGEKLEGIKVGDKVIFNKFSGNEIEDGDVKYLIVNAEDILAIIG